MLTANRQIINRCAPYARWLYALYSGDNLDYRPIHTEYQFCSHSTLITYP